MAVRGDQAADNVPDDHRPGDLIGSAVLDDVRDIHGHGNVTDHDEVDQHSAGMNDEAFRTRRFVPVAPRDRPRRSRDAVRVVVTDDHSVLLMHDTDPGLPGSGWWVTPGGGIDAGETPRHAAVRELAEETGRSVAGDALLGPVLTRTVVHGYSDQILTQREWFFILETERFPIDTTGHTESERLTLQDVRWLPVSALADATMPVWPANLTQVLGLIRRPEDWPVEMGLVEESTVRIDEC